MIPKGAKNRARYRMYRLVGRLVGRAAPPPDRPVFVIGTGRCGTTLLEEILGSHPQLAEFPGEANELWYPEAYPYAQRTIETPPIVMDPYEFTRRAVGAWRPDHEDRVRRTASGFLAIRGQGGRRLFFKSAMISFLVPELLQIFPDARFVHLYRNGFSVVESIFVKEWTKYAELAPDEGDYRRHAARYWNACLEEIARIDTDLELTRNGCLHELSYEDLCAEPTQQLTALAAFLDLDADAFDFDLSRIRSSNDKAAALAASPFGQELGDLMAPQMRARGYA